MKNMQGKYFVFYEFRFGMMTIVNNFSGPVGCEPNGYMTVYDNGKLANQVGPFFSTSFVK